MELTFNDLPRAFTQLTNEVSEIKRLLLLTSNEHQKTDELLTVQDAAKFLSLSVPTIYGLIHKGELPMMKRSKRCYFLKADLITYLKAGKVKSLNELADEVDQYVKIKKGVINGK